MPTRRGCSVAQAVQIGPQKVVGELLFPQPRDEEVDLARAVAVDALEHIDALEFDGRRSFTFTARTPAWTDSVTSAATGTCHGADGMSWVAGRIPSRIRRWTDPAQMPRRSALSSTVMVSSRGASGSKEAILRRSRNSCIPTVVAGLAAHLVHGFRQFPIRALSPPVVESPRRGRGSDHRGNGPCVPGPRAARCCARRPNAR